MQFRLIADAFLRLGNRASHAVSIPCDLNKEDVARKALEGRSGRFLDIGAGDGALKYLLGNRGNFDLDQAFYETNRADFDKRFQYVGLDLDGPADIVGDICDAGFPSGRPELASSFDVVYSNNVFEHLRRPWIAARNIYWTMKPGAICITIVPFAQRYHAVPNDYFRYTHTAIPALFEDAGPVRTIITGYDIKGRRIDWQGSGKHDDLVPVDRFGAWRETWFTVSIIEKTTESIPPK